jgi:hypothetical protein
VLVAAPGGPTQRNHQAKRRQRNTNEDGEND